MTDNLMDLSQTGGGPDTLIKESDTATFMADVIEASQTQPVIVDFWAPWCGPCKQLTPILEKVVTEAKGAVRMVKVNIDENQQIAAQLRVQSIPAVFAFKDGQPVDGFMGAQPESQVRAFVERLAGEIGPSPAEQLLEHGKAALEGGDPATAAQAFGQILQAEPDNVKAIAGLAKAFLEGNDAERARQILDQAPEDANDPDLDAARAALALATQAAEAGDIAPLRAAVEANPGDHQARMDLAVALNGAGDREGAVDQLLEIVAKDREWNDQAARKQLLTLFEAYGPMDEVTLTGRRRLSAILFS